MTAENLKVLYKHRLELGKPVDDILKRHPEFAEEEKKPEPKVEVKAKEKKKNVK